MLLPAFYIPHGGGPCFFMDDPTGMWKPMERFLRGIPSTLPEKPKAVLVVSSHWEEAEFTLGAHPNPPLIYDYYGFPEHTYRLCYPAAGSPALAERAGQLLRGAGIKAGMNATRGLDHGVFVPFLLIYPEADVPIVQLSLKQSLAPAEHLNAGRALAPLRSEGVLIVGSGMSYHNMRGFSSVYTKPSKTFDNWLSKAVCHYTGAERNQLLEQWEHAPEARTCHPREEHLISLLVAAGAAENEQGTHAFSGHVLNVAISGYKLG